MDSSGSEFVWHYIGRFGQLGPLSLEQMEELVRDEVIQADTYVWKVGMANWLRAQDVPEFVIQFPKSSAFHAPPTPPSAQLPPQNPNSYTAGPDIPRIPSAPMPAHFSQPVLMPVSDRILPLAAVLNILLPGVGRMYLGYVGIGIFQLLTSFCGIGVVWAWIDAILMFTGNPPIDGMGRPLRR